MFVEFNKMSKTSRVWVYQASKQFTNAEVQEISKKINVFVTNWNNHGEGLKGSFQIKYNHFIVMAVDENHKVASGCSIDASVQLIKQIERDFNTDLFNKLNISFKIEANINIVNMQIFQKYAKENKINKDTIVFNNLVKNIKEYESNWEVKASDSWHNRFVSIPI